MDFFTMPKSNLVLNGGGWWNFKSIDSCFIKNQRTFFQLARNDDKCVTMQSWTSAHKDMNMQMYLPRKSSWSVSLSYTSTSNSWPGTSWTITWCTGHTHTRTWRLTEGMYGSWLRPHATMNENEHSRSCKNLITQIEDKVKWFMIELLQWWHKYEAFHGTFHSTYLINLLPLGRVCVVNMFGGEGLRADPQYGIGVRQAGHNTFHVVVLGYYILCLQQVDAYHTLGK